jgi:hypothetical protein
MASGSLSWRLPALPVVGPAPGRVIVCGPVTSGVGVVGGGLLDGRGAVREVLGVIRFPSRLPAVGSHPARRTTQSFFETVTGSGSKVEAASASMVNCPESALPTRAASIAFRKSAAAGISSGRRLGNSGTDKRITRGPTMRPKSRGIAVLVRAAIDGVADIEAARIVRLDCTQSWERTPMPLTAAAISCGT